MTFTDTIVTIIVLVGLFFIAYSSIRKQGIGDTMREIKEVFTGKAGDIKDSLKYD